MKEEIVEELIKEICQEIPDDDKEILEPLKEQLRLVISDETKDLDEEESKYILDKIKTSLKQSSLGYNSDNINPSKVAQLSNINNYIVTIQDNKKIYSMEELLEKCSLNQLNLYNLFYNYNFNIYKVEKIKDKKKLIESLKQDITFSFKKYIKRAKNKEIELLKNTLEKNGIMNTIDEDFIPLGYFIPFKAQNSKKRNYIMAKELLDMIENSDFNKTSEETKDSILETLQYFIASKGIVTYDEIEEFIIDVSDFNIKKDELPELVSKQYAKKDKYYYIDKMVDNKDFNKLVKIKEKIEYMPSSEEIMDFEDIIKELFQILLEISNKEVSMREIVKIMFYEPLEVDTLVKKISKKLQIEREDDRMILEDFICDNVFSFPYWIYNGEQEELDDDFFNFDEIDFDDSDSILDKEDLPF